MPTLQEIIDFNPVGKGDADDIVIAMNEVSNKSHMGYAGHYEYKGDRITMDHVVAVRYDSRRGAQTSVLRYNGTPFAVITCAGRELDDTRRTYIVDSEYAAKALAYWLPPPEFEEEHNTETCIGLAYWEGIKVKLGDEGDMGD